MQMKHTKNLNLKRPELGTTLSEPNWSVAVHVSQNVVRHSTTGKNIIASKQE